MPKRKDQKSSLASSTPASLSKSPENEGNSEHDQLSRTSALETPKWSSDTYDPYAIAKQPLPLIISAVLMVGWLCFLVYVIVNL